MFFFPFSLLTSSRNLDIDECQQNPCGPGAYCTNLPGSYRCECPNKYLPRGSAEVGCERAAVDVACARDADCTTNADCITGSCRCRGGYQAKGIDCSGMSTGLVVAGDGDGHGHVYLWLCRCCCCFCFSC